MPTIVTNTFLSISIATLVLTVLGTISLLERKRRKRTALKPVHLITAGIFLASFFFFIPIYWTGLLNEPSPRFLTILNAIHNTFRLFVLDGEITFVIDYANGLSGLPKICTLILGAMLYVAAPIMTFGVVLSMFRNIAAYRKYYSHYFSDVYIFSELNTRSIALAENIHKKEKNAVLLFTNVSEKINEVSYELIERAEVIRAIVFMDDLRRIRYCFHSKDKNMIFFLMGGSDEVNIEQLTYFDNHFKNQKRSFKNTRAYIFSDSTITEMVLQKFAGRSYLHVQMVSPNRALINDMMYRHGVELFENATSMDDGQKEIGIVLLGMGSFGTELLRTLPWLCQMYGYRFSIYAFDQDPLCASKFSQMCPELMDETHNGPNKEYNIRIYSGIRIETIDFNRIIDTIPVITQVYVSLGNAEKNTNAAVLMRMLCERKKQSAVIYAMLTNSEIKDNLENICNFKNQSYAIDFIGDIKSVYSEDVIMHSELEEDAKARHLKWGDEVDFWKYAYNYRSSMASAIHFRIREKLGMPGAGKKEQDLTEEEKNLLEVLEHRRWNAYTRCEGYVYSGSPEKETRNDLAKMHHNLTTFENLPEEDKRKDRSVGSK